MTGGGRPLSWPQIEECLRDLGDELARRGVGKRSIMVVGGAYLAYRQIREATTDVDVVYELDQPLRDAAATVAQRHGLDVDWLNDRTR